MADIKEKLKDEDLKDVSGGTGGGFVGEGDDNVTMEDSETYGDSDNHSGGFIGQIK